MRKLRGRPAAVPALAVGLAVSLVTGLGLGASGARAATPYYGLGFSDGNLDVPGDGDRSLGTVNLTAGVRLLPFLGIEFEAGVASDDTDSILAEPLVNYQAALVNLGWRWDRVGVYALAGQARLDIDESLSDVESGNAFGGGINFFGSETTALNLHVLRFDDESFTTATIGFQHHFGGFR